MHYPYRYSCLQFDSVVPFFIMGRVTYLHHYLPCLIFAVLNLGFMLDHFILSNKYFKERTRAIAFAICATAIVGVVSSDNVRMMSYLFTYSSLLLQWWWFRMIAWGMEGPVPKGLKWRKSWNMYN